MPNKKNIKNNAEVYGYTYSDFSEDQDEKKITIGYIFMIGGTPISCIQRKQCIVALSTYEVDYVAISYAAC